jgi:hypothetical protein
VTPQVLANRPRSDMADRALGQALANPDYDLDRR